MPCAIGHRARNATGPAFTFFQVAALDRSGAGIGVNENGAGITNPVGLIRDGGQFATFAGNRNFPGLSLTFDVDFRRGNGAIVPAEFRARVRHRRQRARSPRRRSCHHDGELGRGRLLHHAGGQEHRDRHGTRHRQRRQVGNTRTFEVSPVVEGQLLTPAP